MLMVATAVTISNVETGVVMCAHADGIPTSDHYLWIQVARKLIATQLDSNIAGHVVRV